MENDNCTSTLNDQVLAGLLDAIADPVLVLNTERRILTVNSQFYSVLGLDEEHEVIGKRPGDVLECVNASEPGGCGTAKGCANCGTLHAVVECVRTGMPTAHESRVRTRCNVNGGALDLLVQASLVNIGGEDLVFATLRDISAEKRRQLLERVFFHDVLNTAGVIRGLADLLCEEGHEASRHFGQNIHRLSEQIIEEILAQRELLAAEHGELHVKRAEICVPDLLAETITHYQQHEVARGRLVCLGDVPPVTITSDITLLRRILANLVKNALEAIKQGAVVTVCAEDRDTHIALHVHNPGVIPEHIQQQIFQRSFSTKDTHGRGIGTYSIKLFTERYLGGKVSFTSQDPEGTVFTVVLPKA